MWHFAQKCDGQCMDIELSEERKTDFNGRFLKQTQKKLSLWIKRWHKGRNSHRSEGFHIGWAASDFLTRASKF